MTDEVDELRWKVAASCRILGMLGLVRESTGHVSARIPGTNEMWVRCRGGDERGLMFTDIDNVRRVDFDGNGPGMGDRHARPNETPIHGEIYRAYPEVQSVVHAHPYYALLCGVTDVPYKPVFAAYDPASLSIILKGVPIYERSATVVNKEMGTEMVGAMGDRDVLLMRGHGITVSGGSVEAATVQAIRFDRLSQIMWEIAVSGREPIEIGAEDRARYERVGQAPRDRAAGWASLEGAESWTWNHYLELLRVNNVGLPNA
jgi:ribulose-5-phosphate 4-epimerase/fuculose-1-phosphate aldolase